LWSLSVPSPSNTDPLATLDAIPVETILVYLAKRTIAAPKTSAVSAEVSDELLNPKQAAKLLGVATKYVYAHVRELGGIRLGKGPRARLRFSRSKLLKRVAA